VPCLNVIAVKELVHRRDLEITERRDDDSDKSQRLRSAAESNASDASIAEQVVQRSEKAHRTG
jgi:hypothetical protein